MACVAAAQCRKSDLPDSTMTTRSQVTCHSEWAVHYPAVVSHVGSLIENHIRSPGHAGWKTCGGCAR